MGGGGSLVDGAVFLRVDGELEEVFFMDVLGKGGRYNRQVDQRHFFLATADKCLT